MPCENFFADQSIKAAGPKFDVVDGAPVLLYTRPRKTTCKSSNEEYDRVKIKG